MVIFYSRGRGVSIPCDIGHRSHGHRKNRHAHYMTHNLPTYKEKGDFLLYSCKMINYANLCTFHTCSISKAPMRAFFRCQYPLLHSSGCTLYKISINLSFFNCVRNSLCISLTMTMTMTKTLDIIIISSNA